jgi:hypothetical protein
VTKTIAALRYMNSSLPKYTSTKISVQIPFVIPAEAGIQEVLLDSGQKHAGMTTCGNGHFILWSCTQYTSTEISAPNKGVRSRNKKRSASILYSDSRLLQYNSVT